MIREHVYHFMNDKRDGLKNGAMARAAIEERFPDLPDRKLAIALWATPNKEHRMAIMIGFHHAERYEDELQK